MLTELFPLKLAFRELSDAPDGDEIGTDSPDLPDEDDDLDEDDDAAAAPDAADDVEPLEQ
jgi:hypothetical protein